MATVSEMREADIAEVAAFLARQVRPGEAVSASPLSPAQRLRWLLIDCPERRKIETAGLAPAPAPAAGDQASPPAPGPMKSQENPRFFGQQSAHPAPAALVPLGWHIRGAAGEIAGAAVCVPFQIGAGEFRCTALMFAKFFVDPAYRGMGVGILMRFVREGARFPLFVTSTNAVAGKLFSGVGARQIDGMDHTMLGIVRPMPLVEEWLYRKTARAAAARLLSLPAGTLPSKLRASESTPGELRRIESAEDPFLARLPAAIHSLAVIRDRAYLRWRYFAGDADKHVYCFQSKNEEDRLVVVNLVRSGYRGQIRVVNVLDVWPPATEASAPGLAGALARQYRGQFDAIWLRSQPVAAEESMRRVGFIRHAFPAPLGWYIDREKRLPTDQWYLTPGESE